MKHALAVKSTVAGDSVVFSADAAGITVRYHIGGRWQNQTDVRHIETPSLLTPDAVATMKEVLSQSLRGNTLGLQAFALHHYSGTPYSLFARNSLSAVTLETGFSLLVSDTEQPLVNIRTFVSLSETDAHKLHFMLSRATLRHQSKTASALPIFGL